MPIPHATFLHTHAAILSIGDELTRGQMLDTNSRDLSALLLDLGVPTIAHLTIPDDRDAITRALRQLAAAAPLVIVTGGLGPTADDLTRDALADVLAEPLVEDADALAALEALLRARNRPLTPPQRVQTLRPTSAHCLPNARGTAPGLFAFLSTPNPTDNTTRSAASLFCLPGPPNEWRPMFDRDVRAHLNPPPGLVIRTRLLRVIGLSEAYAATMIPGLMARDRRPQVGITASDGVLTWRICSDNTSSPTQAESDLDSTEALIRSAMAHHVIAGAQTPAQALVARLTALAQTVTTAESCTGGLIASAITDVPGSSAAFRASWVTYSNDAKSAQLAVSADTLREHGAVSAPTVREMATGALARAQADFALAVSGVAGPDGGTDRSPVGTVWIALADRASGSTLARRLLIPGDRSDIRRRTVQAALGMLLLHLPDPDRPDVPSRLSRVQLPWQVEIG
ncbi:MAG: CinA family nicotinamide mononucleotide deamidase-related protein [Phycisphaeraceae bacterium]|nr:CinA family nicotinamide mononucleotide deamidase-related protein [Phycisphaeraceae bacterium]